MILAEPMSRVSWCDSVCWLELSGIDIVQLITHLNIHVQFHPNLWGESTLQGTASRAPKYKVTVRPPSQAGSSAVVPRQSGGLGQHPPTTAVGWALWLPRASGLLPGLGAEGGSAGAQCCRPTSQAGGTGNWALQPPWPICPGLKPGTEAKPLLVSRAPGQLCQGQALAAPRWPSSPGPTDSPGARPPGRRPTRRKPAAALGALSAAGR